MGGKRGAEGSGGAGGEGGGGHGLLLRPTLREAVLGLNDHRSGGNGVGLDCVKEW